MIFIVVLDIAVAWWNCYSVAQIWNERTTTFESLLKWSAVIQSVAGFSVPIVLLLTAIYTGIFADSAYVPMVQQGVANLWYAMVVIPVVGSGFIIWGHSVREAIRNRSAANIGVAAYNTVAQVSNTASMLSSLGDVFSGLGDLFDGDSFPFAIVLIVVGIVLVSIFSSIFFTLWLIGHYANKARYTAQNAV
jgi:hypothetical protein